MKENDWNDLDDTDGKGRGVLVPIVDCMLIRFLSGVSFDYDHFDSKPSQHRLYSKQNRRLT